MTTQSSFKSKLILSAFAALFAAATSAAFAGDEVKAGGPSDKPGRTIDDASVKARGATDKPGRTADEEKKAVKAKYRADQPGRTADAERQTVKTKYKVDQPGRTADADTKKKQNY